MSKPTAPPGVTVDYDRYAHYLEHADLSDDEKRAFIEALWTIIVGFVDMGFNAHPSTEQKSNISSDPPPDVVKSDLYLTKNISTKPVASSQRSGEGVKT